MSVSIRDASFGQPLIFIELAVRHSFCVERCCVGSKPAEQQHVYERRPGDACAALPGGYHRREPEKTVLYQAVQAHLATFLAELREVDERGLPQYIELEFTRYLACGILSEGFAHRPEHRPYRDR